MNGKDKCRILKQIRREIAEKNDIEWVVSECKHKGNCKGTCPKCEAEVRKLENALSLRARLGKAVTVVGVSALCTAGLTACSVSDLPFISSFTGGGNNPEGDTSYTEVLDGEVASQEDLAGAVDYPEDETETPSITDPTTSATDPTTDDTDIEDITEIELAGEIPAE